MITNAILLTGGSGTRVSPASLAYNKHLILLNKKLVVDYSLSTLQSLGVKNVSIIMGGEHYDQVVAYLQDGSQYGMSFNYIYQSKANGIAAAINLARRYVQDGEGGNFVAMLGDNYFEHPIEFQSPYPGTAQIVLHKHPELQRFGVASIKNGAIAKVEEKPTALDGSMENYAIAGCYLFDQHYFDYFRNLKPSARGEFEITGIIEQYRQDGALDHVFTKGVWSDVGTHQSLLEVHQHLIKKEKNGTTH